MQFQLRVRAGEAPPQDMVVTAASRISAARSARGRGLTVLSIEAVGEAAVRPTRGRFATMLFCEQLCTLLDAGLNLPEALQTLHDKEDAAFARTVLAQLQRELQTGRTFSDALAGFGGLFPDILVAAVRANERTASLATALKRYATYEAAWQGLKRRLLTASVYPGVLLGVGSLVILFLISYVLPKFSAVYEGSGREMPGVSQGLVAVGNWLRANGMSVAACCAATAIGLAWALRQRAVREQIAARLQALPGIRLQMRMFRLARWLRTIGMLVDAGIPLLRALEMSQDLFVGDERKRLGDARDELARGRQLSDALAGQGLMTPVALSLIRVGERSGRLGAMLEHAAQFHDEAVSRWIERTTRLVEPLLMALIGVVIGGVVVTMYMPIFDLAGGL